MPALLGKGLHKGFGQAGLPNLWSLKSETPHRRDGMELGKGVVEP